MPTYFERMTPVFLVTKNGVDTPATMIYRGSEPIFFHLYTNQTIGNYKDYTGIANRIDAYRHIYTSNPVYPGHSLYQILTRTGSPIVLKHPAMQEMFKRREPVVTSDPQRIAIAKKAACCLGCRGLEFGDALVAELIAKSQRIESIEIGG